MSLFGDDQDIVEEVDALDIEQEPEAGLMPPRDNALCLGHGHQEEFLLKLYNHEKMPHALIFAGADGIGKQTFAFRVARFLLSQEVVDPNQDALFGPEETAPAENMDIAEDHPTYRRIAAGGHSDFLHIDRLFDEAKGVYKGGVEVAEIRKVAPFLRMTAAEGGWRVVIINDADTMNRNAQNAILKILEEPPENTLLILVAHRVGALIPTIRSRARVMNFQSLSLEDMQTLLQKQGHVLAINELQALYTLSEGSLGKALSFIDEGGLDVMGRVVSMFENYPRWKWSQIHVVAEELARPNNVTGFLMFQNVMHWIARQLVTNKARRRDLPSGPMSALSQFQEILNKSSLETLTKICDNLQDHFDTVNRGNLEKRQAVMKAFAIFTEPA